MATIRTEAQLESLFIDNDLGDISAGDGRDFIATFFGLATTSDPGPNNDSQDTAGIGAFFSVGSRWQNVITQVEWTCFDGTPGLAVWNAPSSTGHNPVIIVGVPPVTVTFTAPNTWTISSSGSGAPLTLQPPLDTDFALELKQHSSGQSGNMLQFSDSSGNLGGATINSRGEFSNAGSPGVVTGVNNERFGVLAGLALGVATDCTFVGFQAGEHTTSGPGNTAIGSNALNANNLGSGHTAIGANALGNSAGDHNVGIGLNCMFQCSGSGNVAVGTNANAYPGAGSGNTFVGDGVAYNFVTGGDNVAVGAGAGNLGMNNTCTLIGAGAQATGTSAVNQTAIGFGSSCPGDNEYMFGSGSVAVYHFPGSACTGLTFVGGLQGFVPNATGAGSGTYLDHTGAWSVPPTGTVTAPMVGAGTFGPGVMLDPSGLNPGTIPAGVMLSFTQLTSVPPAVTPAGGNVSVTTTNAFVTVLSFTASFGIHGCFNIVNTGVNQARISVNHTDPNQGSLNQQTVIGGGSQLGTQQFDTPAGLFGSGRPPYTQFDCSVQSAVIGSPTTLQIYWSILLNQ